MQLFDCGSSCMPNFISISRYHVLFHSVSTTRLSGRLYHYQYNHFVFSFLLHNHYFPRASHVWHYTYTTSFLGDFSYAQKYQQNGTLAGHIQTKSYRQMTLEDGYRQGKPLTLATAGPQAVGNASLVYVTVNL